MKKYSFLVYHKEYINFLEDLRELGVVHIVEKKAEEKETELESQFNLVKRYNEAIRFLKRREAAKEQKKAKEPQDPMAALTKLEELQHRTEELEQKRASLRKEINKLEPWGNYSVSTIRKMEEEGYTLHLFTTPAKRFDPSWHDQYDIVILNQLKGNIYFAVVTHNGETVEIDAEPEPLAQRSLEEAQQQLKAFNEEMVSIIDTFDTMSQVTIPSLQQGLDVLMHEIEFKSTLIDTEDEAEGTLKVLEGWVPEDKEKKLVAYLDSSEVYYLGDTAGPKDKPPILLRNNRFTRLAEPIGNLFDLPNYKELDLTPFFAPFFMLFFGFCLGDAGYGLIFVILALVLRSKVKKQFKPILTLAFFLGLATVIFGIISGTFFGINLIDTGYTISDKTLSMLGTAHVPALILDKLQGLLGVHFDTQANFLEAVRKAIGDQALAANQLKILKYTESDYAFLNSFRFLMQNPLNMFYLSMMIGGVQIIFGKILLVFNLIKRHGIAYGISTLGWVLLILTLVVFVGGNQLNLLDPEKGKPVFYGMLILSGGMIVFMNNPKAFILLRPLNAIWDTYGVVTGVFGDLLSYIRLFAIGISSAILGFVFNDISLQLLHIPYIGWLFFIILLLLGHGLNILLSSLGAFVHPMRLTFVEFYKNAGFEGGGKAYKPFSK